MYITSKFCTKPPGLLPPTMAHREPRLRPMRTVLAPILSKGALATNFPCHHSRHRPYQRSNKRRFSPLSWDDFDEEYFYIRRNIDETDARDEAARSDLQHIAIRDGQDLWAEYEAGNIGLSGLKALAPGDPLPSTPSPDTEPEVPSPPILGHSAPSVLTETSGGAKAIATAFGGANAWPGIIIQAKSVNAVCSRFAGNGYNPRETNPVTRLCRTDRETIMLGTPAPQAP
ncbi:hypothetical protein RSOLAG1IB_10725 [Rhizoctonia solani AG-1 IB]|uniref:Uncharacterized protein n=1 Tax=Thanatephorus cucumeris (strain AG1-IB / isolate 7/3/14) TaxID=1108050 RepID=A0A0B7G2Q0_THACB|nr:hypothetical protein RSOLAG1IB_10725 [Rhizoctonia solani AG-1 IB]